MLSDHKWYQHSLSDDGSLVVSSHSIWGPPVLLITFSLMRIFRIVFWNTTGAFLFPFINGIKEYFAFQPALYPYNVGSVYKWANFLLLSMHTEYPAKCTTQQIYAGSNPYFCIFVSPPPQTHRVKKSYWERESNWSLWEKQGLQIKVRLNCEMRQCWSVTNKVLHCQFLPKMFTRTYFSESFGNNTRFFGTNRPPRCFLFENGLAKT